MPSTLIRSLIVIFALWLLVHAGGYCLLGPQLRGDSPLYVEGAHSILKGDEIQGRAILSKGYLHFLAATYGLGGDHRTVVFLQTVMALGAAFFLFSAGRLVCGDAGGLLASLFYLINVDIQLWNYYLLPETFTTFLLIALLCLTIFYRKRAGWGAVIFPCAFLFIFSRPETKYLLLPFILFWISLKRLDSFLLGAMSLLLICFSSISPASRFSTIAMHDLANGVIIWGYNSALVSPPEGVAQIPIEKGYLRFLLSCFVEHPWWLLKVLAYRALFFVTHYRPYYSLFHNVVAVLGTCTMYTFALAGTFGKKCPWRISALIWSLYAMQAAACLIITLDWDCRFEGRAAGLLCLLAGAGAVVLWDRGKQYVRLKGLHLKSQTSCRPDEGMTTLLSLAAV